MRGYYAPSIPPPNRRKVNKQQQTNLRRTLIQAQSSDFLRRTTRRLGTGLLLPRRASVRALACGRRRANKRKGCHWCVGARLPKCLSAREPSSSPFAHQLLLDRTNKSVVGPFSLRRRCDDGRRNKSTCNCCSPPRRRPTTLRRLLLRRSSGSQHHPLAQAAVHRITHIDDPVPPTDGFHDGPTSFSESRGLRSGSEPG